MKSTKGITLIALIITMIVLLILAGVTVASLTGNGILEKSKEAKEKYNIEQTTEELELKVQDLQVIKQGNATLNDFAQYLKDDETATYVISLTKEANINGKLPDLTNATEMYVTYNNYDFEVDSNLKVTYIASISTSDSNVNLGDCSRYIKVTVTKSFLGKMTLNVNIPETDSVKSINYYVNNKLVYSGTEKSYTVTGLENEREYETYAIVKYNNEKNITTALVRSLPDADMYVSTNGSDSTGDGSIDNPYASINKAINVAENGTKIYVCPGTYELSDMQCNYGVTGISDLGKNIEVFGQNDETILIYNPPYNNYGNALNLRNSNSIVRNLTYIFTPNNDHNYARAMFAWCDGTISNVFFRISGDNNASYLYNNGGGYIRVNNCTFFHDKSAVDGNYSGTCKFNNIATNVVTQGTNTNVITKSFGTITDSLETLINASKTDSDFISNQVGVFYGDYAWE